MRSKYILIPLLLGSCVQFDESKYHYVVQYPSPVVETIEVKCRAFNKPLLLSLPPLPLAELQHIAKDNHQAMDKILIEHIKQIRYIHKENERLLEAAISKQQQECAE